jgi:tripartite-type tricarboxylate transporter receptor subunit TctC
MKRLIASLACGLALSAGLATTALAEYPERPIRVIVPTDAGGSVDAIARVIQRHVEANDPLGQKLAVVNMPGAGGTIATRNVRDADPDGYTIGLWHEGLVTSRVMGVVDFDHSDLRILGGTIPRLAWPLENRTRSRPIRTWRPRRRPTPIRCLWPPTWVWPCISCR